MRPDRSLAAAVAALGALLSTPVRAADPPPRAPYVFVGDPAFGVESSTRSLDSLGRVFFRYEDTIPRVDLDEGRFTGKALAYLGRTAKLLFIDEPLAELTATTVHEVAGHGGRARELQLRPTFSFHLPGIYRVLFARNDDEAAAYTSYGTRDPLEHPKRIVGTLGGLEANYVHAWWINARVVRADGWVHHGDLLVYGASKVAYATTFLSPVGASGSNDVLAYVEGLRDLSNGWRAEDRRRVARRLTAGYLWNLADPTLLYAIYGTLVSSLYRGERVSRMPLPSIGGTTVMVSPRFALSPFGAEQALDVFLARGGRLLDVYARVGTSGLASYYGAGARALGLEVGDRLTLGGELDIWRQPELLLDERGLYDRPQRVGVNVGVYAEARLTKVFGITGKLAGKTPGYVMGQPLAGGPHGYVGLSVRWP